MAQTPGCAGSENVTFGLHQGRTAISNQHIRLFGVVPLLSPVLFGHWDRAVTTPWRRDLEKKKVIKFKMHSARKSRNSVVWPLHKIN